jgi:hypothetical protein
MNTSLSISLISVSLDLILAYTGWQGAAAKKGDDAIETPRGKKQQ